METDSRNFQPHHPENRGCAGGKTTPVVGGKLGVLETGIEKMKINDPENGECFCDIEPEQPLHRSRINGFRCLGQGGCSFNGSERSEKNFRLGKRMSNLATKCRINDW